jgi:hypothetical protein
MALGKLDIQKTHDDFTVIFEENNGSSYAAGFNRTELPELLSERIHFGFSPEDIRLILRELDKKGRVAVDNVNVLENELTTAGLTNLPYEG